MLRKNGDIRKKREQEPNLLADADAVPLILDIVAATLTNSVGGSLMVDLAKKNNVKRFIYYQTALCYGLKPQEQPITLNHPRNPQGSSYAISKTAQNNQSKIYTYHVQNDPFKKVTVHSEMSQ